MSLNLTDQERQIGVMHKDTNQWCQTANDPWQQRHLPSWWDVSSLEAIDFRARLSSFGIGIVFAWSPEGGSTGWLQHRASYLMWTKSLEVVRSYGLYIHKALRRLVHYRRDLVHDHLLRVQTQWCRYLSTSLGPLCSRSNIVGGYASLIIYLMVSHMGGSIAQML